MRRLRVLMVTVWYPTSEHLHRQTFVRDHARAAATHHDVTVLHLSEDPPRKRERAATPPSLADPPVVVVPRPPRRGSRSFPLRLWSAVSDIRDAARSYGADLLHAHMLETALPTVLAGRMLDIPVVATEHYSGFLTGAVTPWQRRKARWAFRRCDAVLPVSEALCRAMLKAGIRGRFEVVPNAVDASLFHPPAADARATPGARIVYVGRLEPVKGPDVLLSALGILRARERRGWHLTVVGEGPLRDALTDMAAAAGIGADVEFLGALPPREVAAVMRRCDVVVVPSRAETFGLSALEASATGIPVIAARTGGLVELVSPERGRLVPPEDPPALADAIGAFLDGEMRIDGLSVARSVREGHSLEAVGETLDGLYASVLAQRNNPSGASAR